MTVDWKGVFPAVTTQLREDLSIDLTDTQRVVDDLIRDGVTGVIALGTVGENNSLEPQERFPSFRRSSRWCTVVFRSSPVCPNMIPGVRRGTRRLPRRRARTG